MGVPQPWRCIGPKLKAFKFTNTPERIKFIEYLGGGLHSHVFKVSIEEKTYALKTFKFLDRREVWPNDGMEMAPIDPNLVFNHNDPFNCECRAYGRLKETGREDLAAKAYGYIMIDQWHEALVGETFGITDWQRHSKTCKSIRAIVKEYIPSSTPFTPEMVPKMMRNLSEINRLGIQVWDIREDNYRCGQLTDLSQARTVPHFLLQVGPNYWQLENVNDDAAVDFEEFDTIISRWNEEHPSRYIWARFTPTGRYYLRNRPLTSITPENCRNVVAAAAYDWKRAARVRQKQKIAEKEREQAERENAEPAGAEKGTGSKALHYDEAIHRTTKRRRKREHDPASSRGDETHEDPGRKSRRPKRRRKAKPP